MEYSVAVFSDKSQPIKLTYSWDKAWIAGLVTIWGGLAIWQYSNVANGSRSILLISWLLSGAIILVKVSPPSKRIRPAPIIKNVKSATPSKKTSSLKYIFPFFLIVLFEVGVVFEINYLIELAVVLVIAKGIYDAICNRRRRVRLLSFYYKIYIANGILPYAVAVISVSITAVIALLLISYGPSFMNASLINVKTNVMSLPVAHAYHWGGWAIGLVALIPLLALLPVFALQEEQIFRRGRTKASELVYGAIIFGLVHGIMGVPLYIAIALISAGLCHAFFYRFNYNKFIRKRFASKRAEILALLPVTTMHTIHNTILILLAFVFLIMS